MKLSVATGLPVVPVSYRLDWILFTDWCAAFDLQPLPASPITVARFLAFEPHHAPATLRRRVTAINHVHATAGLLAPGTATAIRILLSQRDRHTTRARDVIKQLPTSGWPAGMFGRRDALICTLTCIVGLPIPATAVLRCGDLIYRPDTRTVHIGAGHDITTPATTEPYGLYAVWRRWAVLRDRMIRYPAPIAWAGALHTASPVVDTETAPYTAVFTAPPAPHGPDAAMFPALDRWGQPRTPDHTEPISTRAISHILATHLDDTTAFRARPSFSRTPPGSRCVQPDSMQTLDRDDPIAPTLAAPRVDGVAARRHALDDLATLEQVYTDIDARTAELLARTEQLLHDWKAQ